MTKEEAITKYIVPAIEKTWNDKRCKEILEALEQEPCEDVAKERYEDLCEYFGGAKNILKNREDFKAWLDRIKWHIHKAEELSAENDDLRDQLAMRDRFQKQEPCDDVVSRRAAIEIAKSNIHYGLDKEYEYSRELLEKTMAEISSLPPVTPQPKMGHWIRWYEQKEHDWGIEHIPHCKCSECGKEYDPYSIQFIKFCNECGAKMI